MGKSKTKAKKSSGPQKLRYYIIPIWMFDMLYPKIGSTFRINPTESEKTGGFVYDGSKDNPFTKLVDERFPLLVRVSKCLTIFDIAFTAKPRAKDEECRNKKLNYYELPLLEFEKAFPAASTFYLIHERVEDPEKVIIRFDETMCLPERADLDIDNEEFLFYSGKCLNPDGKIPDIPDFQERTTEELVQEMAERMNFPDPSIFDRSPEDFASDPDWCKRWHNRSTKHYR